MCLIWQHRLYKTLQGDKHSHKALLQGCSCATVELQMCDAALNPAIPCDQTEDTRERVASKLLPR